MWSSIERRVSPAELPLDTCHDLACALLFWGRIEEGDVPRSHHNSTCTRARTRQIKGDEE